MYELVRICHNIVTYKKQIKTYVPLKLILRFNFCIFVVFDTCFYQQAGASISKNTEIFFLKNKKLSESSHFPMNFKKMTNDLLDQNLTNMKKKISAFQPLYEKIGPASTSKTFTNAGSFLKWKTGIKQIPVILLNYRSFLFYRIAPFLHPTNCLKPLDVFYLLKRLLKEINLFYNNHGK